MPVTVHVPNTFGAQFCICEMEVVVALRHEKGNITLFGRRDMKGTVQGNENFKTLENSAQITSADFL